MKVDILGAGPAGLYAAILLKHARPDLILRVWEQNPADATFGFGVVFSDDALAFLRKDDPETADLIEPHMVRWSDIDIVHRGRKVTIDGIGFAGIGRLALLQLLQKRAAGLGVIPEYDRFIHDTHDLDADLIIGADGLNSRVRAQGNFGDMITHQSNRFVWYGADCTFDALTQTFVQSDWGPMNAHHYSYASGRSTFIVEMTQDSFAHSGFDGMSEPAYRAACASAFADALQGAPLIANNSVWRQFPNLSCTRWHDGNRVLVGDALHTAHFSIGSGTRLALEDVIALVRALEEAGWDTAAALPAYQAARGPVLGKLVRAARSSAAWYDDFADHMALDPWAFALSYIRRAGRLTPERVQRMSPGFARDLAANGVAVETAP